MLIKKRIDSITKKYKLSVASICIAILVMLVAVGCTFTDGNNGDKTPDNPNNTENQGDNTVNKRTDEDDTNEGGDNTGDNNTGNTESLGYIDGTHKSVLMSLEGSNRQCAVAFIGYSTEGDKEKVSDFIKNSKAGRIIPFISKLADSDGIVARTGDEYYCIVPGSLDDKVYVYEWIRTEENDFAGERGKELYMSSNGKPFIIACNISDIMTDMEIVIEKVDGTKFVLAPAISLMDGSTVNAMAEMNENMDFYDISIYEEEDILLPKEITGSWVAKELEDFNGNKFDLELNLLEVEDGLKGSIDIKLSYDNGQKVETYKGNYSHDYFNMAQYSVGTSRFSVVPTDEKDKSNYTFQEGFSFGGFIIRGENDNQVYFKLHIPTELLKNGGDDLMGEDARIIFEKVN